jgi:hypothetical protein
MDSHNEESRNVRRSGPCKGLPEGTRALGRVPLQGLRARLSSAPVVRIQPRAFRAHRRTHGDALAGEFRLVNPRPRSESPSCSWGHPGLWFQRVERARPRDAEGGAAGPRSGRKRSGPRSSPVAAAATAPGLFRRGQLSWTSSTQGHSIKGRSARDPFVECLNLPSPSFTALKSIDGPISHKVIDP